MVHTFDRRTIWMKRWSVARVFICILSYVICQETETDMCGNDSPGYRFCESELSLCRNDPSSSKGFECYCAEGKVKIEDMCQDIPANLTDSPAELDSTSSPLYSSSVFSSSGTENTGFETFNDSSESDITNIFYTSLDSSSTHSPSTFDPPALTTPYNHDSSSLISNAPDVDYCARHQCSQNAICIILPHGFTCQCKVGYVPHKNFSSTKSHCLRNCTVKGCEDACKEVRCILTEEEEGGTNSSICLHFENRYSGWPIESIIVCCALAIIALLFIVSTALLLHRNKKLKRISQFEEKQIVYSKMDKGSVCNESRESQMCFLVTVL